MAAIIPENTERFRYWQGQKLLSRDLQDQFATDAQMRWWHNRALHNAYGVRRGLKVSVSGNGIEVEDGIAYDCFGRELILQQPKTIPPDSAGKTVLMIRYKETAEFASHRDLLGVCAPCGPSASSNAEEPEFFWADADSFSFRDGVPLFNAAVKPGEVFRPPVSRPLARPRIGSGQTVPGDTAWELWSETALISNDNFLQRRAANVGIQVTIDTSAAGFTETPCYFAWLQGQLWSRANIEFFPLALDHITNTKIKRFTFRLWLPAVNAVIGKRARILNSNFQQDFLSYARKQKLYVCWMGVQDIAEGHSEVQGVSHELS